MATASKLRVIQEQRRRSYSTMATQARVSSESESESESDSEQVPVSTGTEPAVPSLLDRLRAPQKSDLTRKRSLQKNPAPGESQRKKRPSCSTNPKSVTPFSRVREFPNENPRVSAGKLFCTACREEISLKRSIIANHVASAKHKQSKVKLSKKESREKMLLRLWYHMTSKSIPEVRLFQQISGSIA